MAIFSNFAVIFENIKKKVYFSLYLFFGGAEAIYSAHLSFEGGNVDGWVVAGVRLEYHVGVCWLTAYLSCEFAIVLTLRQYIQENSTEFVKKMKGAKLDPGTKMFSY